MMARNISAHSASVMSLGQRSLLRSYRDRFSVVHIRNAFANRSSRANHRQLNKFKMFANRHSHLDRTANPQFQQTLEHAAFK